MRITSYLSVVVALLLVGCATAPNVIHLTDGGAGQQVVRTFQLDPVMLSGLSWSDDLKRGNFVTVLGKFPTTAASYAEWDPLRIRYQAHAVSADGTEYTAQAVFAGLPPCATAPVLFIFVEGLQKPEAEVKVITLSTLVDRAYTPDGQEIKGFEPARFQTSAMYRKEFALQNGMALTALRQVGDMSRVFANWSLYKTPGGVIITPLDQTQVKYLSGINPQYGYWEKLLGTARGSVQMDLVATAIGVGFDVISAASAPSKGFDAASVLSRQQQGYNMAVLEGMRTKSAQACEAAKTALKGGGLK